MKTLLDGTTIQSGGLLADIKKHPFQSLLAVLKYTPIIVFGFLFYWIPTAIFFEIRYRFIQRKTFKNINNERTET